MLLQRTKIPLYRKPVADEIGRAEEIVQKTIESTTEKTIIRTNDYVLTKANIEKELTDEITTHYHPISPASVADASSVNNRVYYSTTLNQLVFKDGTGNVNVLQQSIGDGQMGLRRFGEQEALNVMLGASGMDYIPSRKTGRWAVVQCLTDTVFASLEASAASNMASLLGATVAANTVLYGKFTTINCSAGSVLAYRY